MADLEIRNLVKDYGAWRAIRDVSFSAAAGEFLVMVGPSGCGKSTILRAIAGLEPVTSGEIRIGGTDITTREPSDRGVAMVFQNYALYPHMTVRQNMGFALKVAGRPRAEIDAAVDRAARILRIEAQLDKKPKALSGGQKQRVAIGRAITRAPEVFLFDEPLSNLDAALRSQMRIELGRLHAELGATMVYVTHDQTEAMTMASRIVVLNGGQMEQVGPPLDLYNRPANRFVAGFLGSPRMNFLAGQVVGVAGDTASVRAEGLSGDLDVPLADGQGLGPGQSVTIGIRPEAFTEDLTGVRLAGRVAVVESLGRETLLYLDAAPVRAFDSESLEGHFAIHRTRQIDARMGDALTVGIAPRSVYLFDADDRAIAWPTIHA